MFYIYTVIMLIALLAVRHILQLIKNYKKKQKGEKGERIVHNILASLPKRKYKVIDNVLIKVNQRTTQIDHIVVSRYGVFVIETKNYKGMIKGSEDSEYWMQALSGQKNFFYNPIKQNLTHCKAILKYTKQYDKLPVVSIIAFSKECNLQVTSETEVVKFSKLNKTIRSYRRKRLSKKTMLSVYERIVNDNMTKRRDHRQHIHSVKANVKSYERNIKKNVCPRCGKRLITRNKNHKRILRCKDKRHCGFVYYAA